MLKLLKDTVKQLKRREVRLGIILVSVFCLGIVDFFVFARIVDFIMMLMMAFGFLEVVSAIYESN